jgi:ABC-type nitrate/sulfonate/bicarbonate transport system substrate-binding protein
MRALVVGAVSRNYFNMPLWAARHAGFFASEGLSVSIQLIEAIDEVTQHLRDGDLDLALGVTENVILDREQGGRLQVVGGNVNKLPFSLIARPHIRSYADLRGARIGVSSVRSGSSSLVMKLLAGHGLRHPQDYDLVPVGPILARWELLQKGEIDAGLQGAPLNHIAVDSGYSDLGSPRSEFPDFQFTSLDADADWARRNEDILIRFLRAFLRAHRWFYANREGATEIALEETGLERRYAERAWDEYVGDEIFPRDGRASVAGIRTLIEVSALIREIRSRSGRKPEDYIEHAYLDAAEASLAGGSGRA